MRYSTVLGLFVLISVVWTAFAWHMHSRSQDQNYALQQAVRGLWGSAHRQLSPTVRDGGGALQPLQKANAQVTLNLEPRQKGLF